MPSTQTLKQPSVLKLAFFTSMFERFGFYVLSFVIVLYAKSEFHLTDQAAFALFGVFSALVYITPPIGGYLADHVFGIRRCIILGLLLEAIGLTFIAIPSNLFFSLGAAFIILGVGFFKIGPTDLMARAYSDNDPRIDSGFTLFYMTMNIGGLAASIASGVIQYFFGWHVMFLTAAIAVYLSLGLYYLLRYTAKNLDVEVGTQKLPTIKWLALILGVIVCAIICALLVSYGKIATTFFFIAATAIFVYFFYEIIKSPREEKFKIIAAVLLMLIGFLFYLFYYQLFTSVTLFINRCVNRHAFGFTIPTTVFLSLDPIWILVLSPLLAASYNFFATRNKDLAVTTKFSFGIFATSLCFFVLVLGTFFPDKNSTISIFWIVLAFFLFTLGELLVGALGVAMVNRIAPKRLYGIMMGAWFLVGMGLSATLSGKFASLASVPDNLSDSAAILHVYTGAFLNMGTLGLIAAAVCFTISPHIKRIAKIN